MVYMDTQDIIFNRLCILKTYRVNLPYIYLLNFASYVLKDKLNVYYIFTEEKNHYF